MKYNIYCRSGNIREVLIFANSEGSTAQTKNRGVVFKFITTVLFFIDQTTEQLRHLLQFRKFLIIHHLNQWADQYHLNHKSDDVFVTSW